MTVLICGDRNWTNRERIREVLLRLIRHSPDAVVRHGANGYDEDGKPSYISGKPTVRGADMIAHEEALKVGLSVDPYPADWKTYGKRAGPVRNQKMLKADPAPTVVVAFHNNLESSKGTGHMVSIARKAGIQTFVLTSNDES